MEFNSQVCTTIEQSKRLLDLGLSGDTADMLWMPQLSVRPVVGNPNEVCNIIVKDNAIPAWSLNRLIEIAGDDTGTIAIRYEGVTFNKDIYFYSHPTTYDNLIDCIEWLIKEDALKKQYLEKKL